MTSLKNDTSKHKAWAALIVWVGLLCTPNAWADRYTNDRDDVSQDDDRRDDAQDHRRNRRDKRRYRKPDRSDHRDAGRSNQRKSRTDRSDRDRRSDRSDAAPRTRRVQSRARRDGSTNRRRTRRDDRYDRSVQDRDDVRPGRRARRTRHRDNSHRNDSHRNDRNDRNDRYDDRGDRSSDDHSYRRRRRHRHRRVNRYGRVNRYDRDDRGYRRAARYDSDSSDSVSRNSESLLRPGTRSHSAYLGFAPGLRADGFPHQFGFHAGYGYHFFGYFAGPVLGLDMSVFGLGEMLRVQTTLVFAWQFQVGNRGLYIAPFAGIGHLHVEGTSYATREILYETAILLFGGELTLMLNDRIRLSLRVPFAVSFDPWAPGVAVSPTLTAGVTF